MSKNSIVEIELSKLKEHPLNLKIYTEKREVEDNELMKSISDNGLLDNVISDRTLNALYNVAPTVSITPS